MPPVAASPEQRLLPFLQSVNVPNLSVLSSGPLPPMPQAMLTSEAIEGLLKELDRSGFEVVVFDTAALLGLSEALVLTAKVDGTVVVVDTTNARKDQLLQAKAMLERTGAQVLGYVANKDPQSGKSKALAGRSSSPEERGEVFLNT